MYCTIRVFYILTFFCLNSSVLSVGSREGETAYLSRVGSYKRLSTEKVSLVFCNIFGIISTGEIVSLSNMCRKTQVYFSWVAGEIKGVIPCKGDLTRNDSQRRFLEQHSLAMLEQCCKYSKQCRKNVATLCCVKNRRYELSRVTSP